MTTATATLLDLKPAEIAVHHRNPRHTVGDLDDLAASIIEHGILEPLVVAPWPDAVKASAAQQRKHLLIAGHRRLAAAVKAGSTTIPCILRPDLDTEAKQLEAMLVENLHRADLTPVEEAEGYQALLEFPGFTQTRLAKDIGQPVSRIRERLKLTKLAQPVKDKLHQGQITITDALAVAEFEGDPAASKTLVKALGTDGFGWTLQDARRQREKKAALAKRVKRYEDAGGAVTRVVPAGGFKPLADFMDDFPRYDTDKQDAWVERHHRDCPGAVLVISQTDYSGEVLTYGCTQPKTHPKPKVTQTKTEIAREKREAEQRAQLKDDTATATALRREHLRRQVDAPDGEGLARSRTIAHLVRPRYGPGKFEQHLRTFLLTLLGVDDSGCYGKGIDTAATKEAQRELLDPALGKLTLAQLVLLDDISENYSVEDLMATPADYFYVPKEWVVALNDDYGYQWSDFERKQFKVDQILTPDTDADADEDADEDLEDSEDLDGGDSE